jgi:branched-chain amino acid transport system permease protein
MLPVLQSTNPGLAGLAFVAIGFGAVALGRDPNGLANLLFGLGRRLEVALWPAVADRLPSLRPRPAGGGEDEEPDGSPEGVTRREEPGLTDTRMVPTEEVAGHGAARG